MGLRSRNEKTKIVIAGGTGFLGTILLNKYRNPETEIVVLTRTPKSSHHNVRYVYWDAKNIGNWARELDRSDMVINLVGKSVNCRYTEKNKAEIIESRVNATVILGKAINSCIFPPKLWINAGSAAIFGDSGEDIKHESSVLGEGFSTEVCKQWEKAFNQARTPHTRKVSLRIGLVLQSGQGLIKPFVNLVRLGLGGKFGSGEQYISWIHEKDFAEIVNLVVERPEIEGVLHCSSPYPVKNKEFMKTIRHARNVSIGLPNPGFLIKIGAVFIGTEAELVLKGRRVVSKVLADKGFNFSYPYLSTAMNHLFA